MITKDTAKEWTVNTDSNNWLIASINESIYNAVSNQKFHCDWYSQARYDISDNEINTVNEYLKTLSEYGYTITQVIYKQTKQFPNKRMRVHICWEN